MPQACAVGAVVILRIPGGEPEFARRHGAVLRLDNQFKLPIFGVAKTPGGAHLDILQGDVPSVTAPEAFGHAIAVQNAAVHFAAGLVKLDRGQLLT